MSLLTPSLDFETNAQITMTNAQIIATKKRGQKLPLRSRMGSDGGSDTIHGTGRDRKMREGGEC